MDVTVYTPDGPCHKCRVTKLALQNAKPNPVPYKTVVADEDTVDRFKAEGHTSFPIVVATFGDGVTWTWSDLRVDHVNELAKLAS